jgi:hypothetical protein
MRDANRSPRLGLDLGVWAAAGAQAATWMVLRTTGKLLASSLRHPERPGDARAAELFLHNTGALCSPECAFDVRTGDWGGVPNRGSPGRNPRVALTARVASGER